MLSVISYIGVVAVAAQTLEPGPAKNVIMVCLIAPVIIYASLAVCMSQGMR